MDHKSTKDLAFFKKSSWIWICESEFVDLFCIVIDEFNIVYPQIRFSKSNPYKKVHSKFDSIRKNLYL